MVFGQQPPERAETRVFRSKYFDENSEEHMPQWMMALVVVLAALAAASSTYTAYKLYQMTDARLVPTKAKR